MVKFCLEELDCVTLSGKNCVQNEGAEAHIYIDLRSRKCVWNIRPLGAWIKT